MMLHTLHQILLGICTFLVLLNTFHLQALNMYGEGPTSASTATTDCTPTATVTITATVTQKEIYYLPMTCLNGLEMCSDAALKDYAAALESYFTDAKQLPLAPRSIADPTAPADDSSTDVATDDGPSIPTDPPAQPTTPTSPPNSTEGEDKNPGTDSTDDFDKTFGRVKTLLGLFTAFNLTNGALEWCAWAYVILSICFYVGVGILSWSFNRKVMNDSVCVGVVEAAAVKVADRDKALLSQKKAAKELRLFTEAEDKVTKAAEEEAKKAAEEKAKKDADAAAEAVKGK